MGLFRKKVSQKVDHDRELIEENTKSIESLIILAKDNNAIVEQLKEIKEKIKYLIASDEDKVYDLDKKIKNIIDDTRIALIKADGETSKKVDDAITQIKLAITDREVKL